MKARASVFVRLLAIAGMTLAVASAALSQSQQTIHVAGEDNSGPAPGITPITGENNLGPEQLLSSPSVSGYDRQRPAVAYNSRADEYAVVWQKVTPDGW